MTDDYRTTLTDDEIETQVTSSPLRAGITDANGDDGDDSDTDDSDSDADVDADDPS